MDRTRRPPLPTRSRDLARQLRRQPTDAERNLWYHLRAGRMQGLKWHRQHPVPPCVVDFLCPRLRRVVEIDGGSTMPGWTRRARRHWRDKVSG